MFGLELHSYGLIIGISIWVGWELVHYQARKYTTSQLFLQSLFVWVVVGGIVGARLYHVVTDWPLYSSHPWTTVYIWRGGLSVIGAVIGGGAGLWWKLRSAQKTIEFPLYLDLAVFGLPVAQAVGRVGNFINQELYGRPTSVPWAIPIEPSHRLPEYQQFATYHPLFAYEMIALSFFAVCLWWIASRSRLQLGSGRLFVFYALYYACVRFVLDFWRIDTRYILDSGITINQALMVLILLIGSWWLRKRRKHATA